MEINIFRIDKDSQTKTKYVVTGSDNGVPNYVSSSTNGEKPLYIYGDKYGKPNIKNKLKLVSKKGHVSTLFPTKENYKGFEVFTGDVKGTDDLILLFASMDLIQLYIAEFKGKKQQRYKVLTDLLDGGLDGKLSSLELK